MDFAIEKKIKEQVGDSTLVPHTIEETQSSEITGLGKCIRKIVCNYL